MATLILDTRASRLEAVALINSPMLLKLNVARLTGQSRIHSRRDQL